MKCSFCLRTCIAVRLYIKALQTQAAGVHTRILWILTVAALFLLRRTCSRRFPLFLYAAPKNHAKRVMNILMNILRGLHKTKRDFYPYAGLFEVDNKF